MILLLVLVLYHVVSNMNDLDHSEKNKKKRVIGHIQSILVIHSCGKALPLFKTGIYIASDI